MFAPLSRTLAALAVAVLAAAASAQGPAKTPDQPKTPAPDTRVYELRIYTAEKGKLDALNARFRDAEVKLFEKHGMASLGYWVPADPTDQRLVYLVAHKERAAADKSWADFAADADWQAVAKASEKDGKLVAGIERRFLAATDYSPPVKAAAGKDERVFELRTYTAEKDRLDALNARFRDHTLKLFEKHGMTNFGYFTVVPDAKAKDDKKEVPPLLIYFLAHKSADDAKTSFDEFRKDPDWVAAKEASEKAAGGSLTVPDGVKSLFLKPTDYSPTK